MTGGAGFIGTNLVRASTEFEENHVIILDNYSERFMVLFKITQIH